MQKDKKIPTIRHGGLVGKDGELHPWIPRYHEAGGLVPSVARAGGRHINSCALESFKN